jgi:hypothetical protein
MCWSPGNNRFNVKPGELWFFDNKVMHRAVNPSDTPRVHIIFDGYPLVKWVRPQLPYL